MALTPQEEQELAQLQAEEGQSRLSPELQATKELMQTGNPIERMGAIAPYMYYKGKDMVESMATRGGPTAGGQYAGGKIGKMSRLPAGEIIGTSLGGAIGAFIGSTSDQGGDVKAGELIADTVSGMFPMRGAKKNATGAMVAETIRSLVDDKKLPSKEALSTAGATAYVGAKIANKMTGKSLTPYDALYEQRKQAFQAVRSKGFVINPLELGAIDPAKQMLAGQSTTSWAIQKNQGPLQSVIRAELGMSEKPLPFKKQYIDGSGKVVLSEIDQHIETTSQPYRDIRAISEQAAKELDDWNTGKITDFPKTLMVTAEDQAIILGASKNLDKLKAARREASEFWKKRNADPEAYGKYQEANANIDVIESQLDRAAVLSGDPKLIERLNKSRRDLAIAYSVKDAVTESNGLVDPAEFVNQRNSGRRLDGWRSKVADFTENFSRNSQYSIDAAPPSHGSAGTSYAVRQLGRGNMEAGLVPAAIPYAGDIARLRLLSEPVQNRTAKFSFNLNPETPASSAVRNFIMQGRNQLPSWYTSDRQPESTKK